MTDVTNASRTLLMDLRTQAWDEQIAAEMGVPLAMLPQIRSSSEVYGTVREGGVLAGVPIAGILGDQQAATFGQACFEPGMAKNTYGTGNFVLLNTGHEPVPSEHGLITTVCYRIGDAPRGLRPGGLGRGHRLAGAVAARQPRADRLRQRDRDAGGHGRRQRRRLHRPGVQRAVRPALALRRPRRASSA